MNNKMNNMNKRNKKIKRNKRNKMNTRINLNKLMNNILKSRAH